MIETFLLALMLLILAAVYKFKALKKLDSIGLCGFFFVPNSY